MKHQKKKESAKEIKIKGRQEVESPKKVGKPQTVFTDEQISQIEALAAFLSIDDIAYYLNIAPRTFYDIKNRDTRVEEAYKKGIAKSHSLVASQLMGFIRDPENTPAKLTAIIFYLKTRAGWTTDKNKNTNGNKLKFVNAKTPIETLDATLNSLEKGDITVDEAHQIADLVSIKSNILRLFPEDVNNKNQMTEDTKKLLEQVPALERVINYLKENQDTPEAQAILECLTLGKKIEVDLAF